MPPIKKEIAEATQIFSKSAERACGQEETAEVTETTAKSLHQDRQMAALTQLATPRVEHVCDDCDPGDALSGPTNQGRKRNSAKASDISLLSGASSPQIFLRAVRPRFPLLRHTPHSSRLLCHSEVTFDSKLCSRAFTKNERCLGSAGAGRAVPGRLERLCACDWWALSLTMRAYRERGRGVAGSFATC